MSPQELQERIKQLEAENFQLKQTVEMQNNMHFISCMSLINSSEDVIFAIDAVNFDILIYNQKLLDLCNKADIPLKVGLNIEELLTASGEFPKWRKACDYTLRNGSFSSEFKTKIDQQYFKFNLYAIKENGKTSGIAIYGNNITEYKKHEDRLNESQRALSVLIGKLPGMTYQCKNDEDWTMYYVSDVCEKLTGYKANELINNVNISYGMLIVEEDREFVRATVQAGIKAKRPWNIEYRILNKLGEEKPVWEQGCGIFDEGGKLLWIEGFVTNMADKKEAEKNYNESIAFRDRVFESSIIPMIVMDGETHKYVDCNTAAVIIYNMHSKADVLNKTPIAFSAPIQYDGTPSEAKANFYINKAIKEGAVHFEWLHQRTNGELWDGEVHLKPFKTDSKYLFQFTLLDITEKKANELKLIEKSKFIESILNISPDFIYIYDIIENRTIYSNMGMQKVLGYSIEEIEAFANHLLKQLMHPDDFSAYTQKTLKSYHNIGDNEVVTHQYRMQNKNNEWTWIESFETIYKRGENNQPIQIFGTGRDITQRKQAEQALSSLATHYAHLSGKSFFEAVSKHIAEEMHLDIVFVGDYDAQKNMVEAVGGWFLGQAMGPMKYSLDETPCQQVVGKKPCVYIQNVKNIFPNDKILEQLDIQGYIGSPIFSKENEAIGIVVGLNKKPLANPEIAHHFFEIFIDRISAEMQRSKTKQALIREIDERIKIETTLRQSEEKYRYIVENAPLSIYQVTIDGKFTFCNSAILKHYECEDFDEFNARYGDIEKRFTNQNELKKYKLLLVKDGFVSGFEMETKLISGKSKWFSFYAYVDKKQSIINGFSLDITERKLAEKAAMESRSRYQMLYESLMDAYAVVDKEGKIIEFNKTFASMLGYSAEELYELTYYDITPSTFIEIDQKIYTEQVLVRGYSDVYEKKYKKKNGKEFPVELRTYLLKDGKGDIVGRWAIIRDITERKKTEHILKASEERLQQLLNTVTDYIYSVTVDKGGKIKTIHGEGCKTVTGYSQEEFINDEYLWYNIIHEEDRSIVVSQADSLMQNIESPSAEHRIVHKSGKIRWVRNTPVIRRNERGEMIGYDGLIADITERKMAEIALKESEELHRKLLMTIPDIIVRTNLRGEIVFVNEKISQLFNTSSHELIGQHILTFIPQENLERVTHDVNQMFKGPFPLREYQLTYNGIFLDCEINGDVVLDASGKPAGMVFAIRDISSKKKAESALIEARQLLETAVEHSPTGIVIAGVSDLKIQHANQAVFDIFSVKSDNFQDSLINYGTKWQLYTPDGRYCPFEKLPLMRALIEGVVVNSEEYIVHSINSKEKWIIANAAPICDVNENVTAVVAVFQDITERKETERKILNASIEAEEKERAYIARELHDGIGPLLSTIKLYIEWLNKPELQTPKEEIINNANKTVVETILAIKEISQKLSPYIVTNFGLGYGLKEYIDKLEESCNIEIHYESNIEIRLSSEIEVTLYRIILECINNTIKYAEAKKIYIKLNLFEKQLFVDYEDDGKGFDYSAIKHNGNGQGIINIKNRITSMGGKIVIESKPDQGFKMKIMINI